MYGTTELLLQAMCQRAGLSEQQLDAVRRGDITQLLTDDSTQQPAADDANDDLREQLRGKTRRLKSSQAQLAAATGLLQQVADMIGCCRRCWGTNHDCPFCSGRGSPGFCPPDPGLPAWIAPALERLEPIRSRSPRKSPTDQKPIPQGDEHD
jgi:hypothetical protein